MRTLKLGNTNIYPITYAHYVYLADGVTTVSARLSSLTTALNNLSLQNSQRIQDIADINALIPTQATTSNKLADKDFVNSSISTNTANFIGTFANVSALNSYGGTLTNNDYAFVRNAVLDTDYSTFELLNAVSKTNLTHFDYAYVVNDTKFDLYRFNIANQTWELRIQNTTKLSADSLNTAFNRYKFNETAWVFEYTLNNSSFTAAQWNAINSGITDSLVTKLDGIESGAQVNTVESVNGKTGAVVLDADDIDGVMKKDGGNTQQTVSLTSGSGTTALGVKSMAASSYISFSGTGGWLGSYGVSNVKRPTFYNGVSHNIAYEENSVFFVQGSSSAAGNSTKNQYLSTKWEGTVDGITTPYNGMKIVYRIATNTGVATAGAVLSIDGGTTYYPVVYNVNSVISTRYGVGSNVILTFNSTQTATAYLTINTSSTITGCWQIMDYDANSYAYLRTYNLNTTDGDRDLLMRYDTTAITAGSYATKYGAVTSAVNLKANPKTGQLKAVKFTENGTDLVNKYESLSNKVTSISSTSTNTQYAGAKAVYDLVSSILPALPNDNNNTYTLKYSNGQLSWVLDTGNSGGDGIGYEEID